MVAALAGKALADLLRAVLQEAAQAVHPAQSLQQERVSSSRGLLPVPCFRQRGGRQRISRFEDGGALDQHPVAIALVVVRHHGVRRKGTGHRRAGRVRCRSVNTQGHQPTSGAPRIVTGPISLTGLTVCAICSGGMTLRTGTSRMAKVHRYDSCPTCARQGTAACKGRSIRMDTCDALVIEHLAQRLFHPDRLAIPLPSIIARRQRESAEVDDRGIRTFGGTATLGQVIAGSAKASAGVRGFIPNGVPEGIRTPDLRFRKPLLYPAELPGRTSSSYHDRFRASNRPDADVQGSGPV